MDQFFWGKRVAELGVSPRPVPFKRLDVDRLSAAIDEMINDREMQFKAGALGEKIRSENGIARAIKIIDDTLKS